MCVVPCVSRVEYVGPGVMTWMDIVHAPGDGTMHGGMRHVCKVSAQRLSPMHACMHTAHSAATDDGQRLFGLRAHQYGRRVVAVGRLSITKIPAL